MLRYGDNTYYSDLPTKSLENKRLRWYCSMNKSRHCPSRIRTYEEMIVGVHGDHTHRGKMYFFFNIVVGLEELTLCKYINKEICLKSFIYFFNKRCIFLLQMCVM